MEGIDLQLDKDPLWQAEDCELLEQIDILLALFATRNVDYHSSCVAGRVVPSGTSLRAEVLSANEAASRERQLENEFRYIYQRGGEAWWPATARLE